MKLSDLKFDGTDYYEDENIIIRCWYIYFTKDILNEINLSELHYEDNTFTIIINICEIKSIKHIYTYDLSEDILNMKAYITLMKLFISEYQKYLRKNKLDEII